MKNIRPKCQEKGCNNLAKSQGRHKDGTHRHKKYCYKHCCGKKYMNSRTRRKIKFPNLKCILCRWEGPCDRHRIKLGKDGGKYESGNVVILCPNCHRLLHLGRIFL